MNKVMSITLHERSDRDKIGDAITDGQTVTIAVDSDYAPLVAGSNLLDIGDFDSTDKTALYRILDKASMLYESGAFVFVVKKSGKTFNLEGSFVRDAEPVDKLDVTAIPDGTPLKLRFEIPGFASNNFREIDLLYNAAFDSGDVALVAELGITLTGDGAEFTIDNVVECKVSVSKPAGASEVYVIDFVGTNDVIAV